MNTVLLSTTDEHNEFEKLAATLGFSILKTFVQKRSHPDPRTYFGRGKLKSVADYLDENETDLVLIDDYLKPLQHYNLEKELKIECIDRVGLILKIFELRASTQEAKLQLESARLTYEIPLLREWIHRSKSTEHPGFMAGGEYRIDIYYDKIRRRLLKISKTIEQIRTDKGVKRNFRSKMGYRTAVLFGYTNAGKSTLFNYLTKSQAFVDEKLFSTLSATSRKIATRFKRTIILTDTIGLVEDMPHWLIEAFKPTFEEIQSADCIIWVIDGTDDIDDLRRKYHVCRDSIDFNGNKKVIPVITKIDLLDEGDIESRLEIVFELMNMNSCEVSGKEGTGVDDLIFKLKDKLKFAMEARITLKNVGKTQNVLSLLYEIADIKTVEYSKKGHSVSIHMLCEPKDLNIIKSRYGNLIKKIRIIK
jgi:GTP-binding protein HflX